MYPKGKPLLLEHPMKVAKNWVEYPEQVALGKSLL